MVCLHAFEAENKSQPGTCEGFVHDLVLSLQPFAVDADVCAAGKDGSGSVHLPLSAPVVFSLRGAQEAVTLHAWWNHSEVKDLLWHQRHTYDRFL